MTWPVRGGGGGCHVTDMTWPVRGCHVTDMTWPVRGVMSLI